MNITNEMIWEELQEIKQLLLSPDEKIVNTLKIKGVLTSSEVMQLCGISKMTALSKMRKISKLKGIKFINGDARTNRSARIIWKKSHDKKLAKIKEFIIKNNPCLKCDIMSKFNLSIEQVNELVNIFEFKHDGGRILI